MLKERSISLIWCGVFINYCLTISRPRTAKFGELKVNSSLSSISHPLPHFPPHASFSFPSTTLLCLILSTSYTRSTRPTLNSPPFPCSFVISCLKTPLCSASHTFFIENSLRYPFLPSLSPSVPKCLLGCLLKYAFYLAPLLFYSLNFSLISNFHLLSILV